MPIYNAPLHAIDAAETRRYAGLMRAKDFDEALIAAACEEALLLAAPRGSWQAYSYDCQARRVLAEPPFDLRGKGIARHLAGCERVILLAATVGEAIEEEVTARFERGGYASSVLLDAAATAAVEQVADLMEKAIRPKAAAQGYRMKWRFSPGYGDWPIEQQPQLVRLSGAADIGISLSGSLMLLPRKSITAIIGLYREQAGGEAQAPPARGCAACTQRDCPSRRLSGES